MRRPSWIIACFVLSWASRSAADEVHELAEDVPVSAAVVVTGAGLIVGTELVKQDLAPKSCVWCDRDAEERDTLNGFDRRARQLLKWRDTTTAARLSDLLGGVVVPTTGATMLGVAGADAQAERKVGNDLLIVLETMALSGVLNQLAKFTIGRERPYAHFREIGDVPIGKKSRDDNLSFYSGHTAQTFTIAASTTTVALLRGYELAPFIALTTAPLAALTGYLRIAADKHYLTDVLAGAAIGSAIGILAPVLLHPRRDDAAPPSPGAPPTATQVFSFGGVF